VLVAALGYFGWTRHLAGTLPPAIDGLYVAGARAVGRLLPATPRDREATTAGQGADAPMTERTVEERDAATVKAAIAMVNREGDGLGRLAKHSKRKGRKAAGRRHRHNGQTSDSSAPVDVGASVPGAAPAPPSELETNEAPAPVAAAPRVMPAHEAHYRQGKLYLRQGKPLLAVESLERCLAKAPRFAPAYRALGAANLALGRKSQAVEAYRQFLVLDPTHPSAAEVESIIDRTLSNSGG
jgi:tetratricopeptide (TPR) repeat protein